MSTPNPWLQIPRNSARRSVRGDLAEGVPSNSHSLSDSTSIGRVIFRDTSNPRRLAVGFNREPQLAFSRASTRSVPRFRSFGPAYDRRTECYLGSVGPGKSQG